MLFMVRPDTKSAHSLADILETIEIAADELMDQRLPLVEAPLGQHAAGFVVEERHEAIRRFVYRVRELELSILAKFELARARARTVSRSDWRLRPIMALFISGTQILADHIVSPQGREAIRFEGSDQVFPFLRSRDLLEPSGAYYDGCSEILLTNSFRLLGLIKLRELLEHCEVALNALDAHYDLYDWNDEASEAEMPLTAHAAGMQVQSDEAAPASVVELLPVEAIDWGVTVGPIPDPATPPAKDANPRTMPLAAPSNTADGNATLSGEPGKEHLPVAAFPHASLDQQAGEATAEARADLPTAKIGEAAAEREPTVEEIAKARAQSDAGLKNLTERLAELKAAAEPGTDNAGTGPARSDAA